MKKITVIFLFSILCILSSCNRDNNDKLLVYFFDGTSYITVSGTGGSFNLYQNIIANSELDNDSFVVGTKNENLSILSSSLTYKSKYADGGSEYYYYEVILLVEETNNKDSIISSNIIDYSNVKFEFTISDVVYEKYFSDFCIVHTSDSTYNDYFESNRLKVSGSVCHYYSTYDEIVFFMSSISESDEVDIIIKNIDILINDYMTYDIYINDILIDNSGYTTQLAKDDVFDVYCDIFNNNDNVSIGSLIFTYEISYEESSYVFYNTFIYTIASDVVFENWINNGGFNQ